MFEGSVRRTEFYDDMYLFMLYIAGVAIILWLVIEQAREKILKEIRKSKEG